MKNNDIQKVMRGLYIDKSLLQILEREAEKIDRSSNWLICSIVSTWTKRNSARPALKAVRHENRKQKAARAE